MDNASAGQDGRVHVYWPRHEIVNAVTHFAGFVFAVGAVPVLILMATISGTNTELYTFIVYSASLILLYLVSTLYHAWPEGRTKALLQKLDHMMVYVLIAGTYTPFLVAELGDVVGWTLFCLLWLLAVFGIGFKAKFGDRYDAVSTVAYLLMGWVGLVAIVPLYEELPQVSFTFVLVGGIAYSIGTVFYRWEGLPHNHGIWHVFCLAGSICHFTAVLYLLDG
ncbi:MAG TPA: hemolysin III family protein [Gammaproteobacteria bacterium]